MDVAFLLTLESQSNGFQNILPFILAILLIFIVPMIMSRYGLSYGDLIRKIFSFGVHKKQYSAVEEEEKSKNKAQRRPPHVNNSTHNDLIQLVSNLLIFSRRNKTGLVYPATIKFGGKTGNLVCFVVTRSTVIGVNCFGFGGNIIHKPETREWIQKINGVTNQLPDPVALSREQYEIARGAMDAHGLKDVPLRVAAVFTNENCALSCNRDDVFNAHDFLSYLKQIVADEDKVFDPNEMARKVNELVYRIRKTKKSRKK